MRSSNDGWVENKALQFVALRPAILRLAIRSFPLQLVPECFVGLGEQKSFFRAWHIELLQSRLGILSFEKIYLQRVNQPTQVVFE